MPASVASGFNTFVPSFDTTGKLVVDYSRNPKKYPVNRYTTLTKVEKSLGYYLQMTVEESARILQSDLSNFIWNDGNDAPTGEWGDESFTFQKFATTRYAYGFSIGYKAEQQADWKILARYAAIKAAQAMVARTQAVMNVLFTTANYAASHQATATALGGGFLSAGTTSTPFFQLALRKMVQQCILDTNNGVEINDFVAVMNPLTATKIAASSEVQDYLKNSPFALAQVRGDSPSQNGKWGLPDQYAGVKIEIEDTVKVTSAKGATRASSFIFTDGTANGQVILQARPSQISVEGGGPSFGSTHVMAYEEMTVEQRDDPDHRRIRGRVVDDFDVQMVAPATAFYLDHCFA